MINVELYAYNSDLYLYNSRYMWEGVLWFELSRLNYY